MVLPNVSSLCMVLSKPLLSAGATALWPLKLIMLPALRQFCSSPSSKDVSFTVKYFPHQLYPEASREGEDKYEWWALILICIEFCLTLDSDHNILQRYKKTKYNDSEHKMQKYVTLMSTYGQQAGIEFDFHGTVANTLDAHRLIQHYQEVLGPEVAGEIVNSLYTQYFTQRAHPSAAETLIKAATAAGIDKTEAEAFVDDGYEGMQETKMLLREQASNGIDSVSAALT